MTSTWLTNRQGDWNLHKYQGIPIKGRVEERLGEGMGRGDSRSRSPGHLWEHGSCHCCALMSLTYRHPRLGLAYIMITSFAHITLLLILLGMLLKKSMWVQARATATFFWTETHTSPGQFHPNARTPSPTSDSPPASAWMLSGMQNLWPLNMFCFKMLLTEATALVSSTGTSNRQSVYSLSPGPPKIQLLAWILQLFLMSHGQRSLSIHYFT